MTGRSMEEFNTRIDVNKLYGIDPVYDYINKKSQTSGHFSVHVDKDNSFNVKFSSVLGHRVKTDDGLFAFLTNKYKDSTLSHAVSDLYDIGFPVDEWVKDYITHVIEKNSNFVVMLQIMATLRHFNEQDSDDPDEPII